MLEISILTNLFGLINSSIHRRLIVGNPFQIYFIVWFFLLVGYYISADSFYRPSELFFLVITLVSLIWICGLFIFLSITRKVRFNPEIIKPTHLAFNNGLFYFSLLACTLIAPSFFFRANELAGGQSIFTVVGYITLRKSMTEDMLGYGWISYFPTLAFVISSISVVRYLKSELSLTVLVFSILLSIYFAFLSTGRTFFLMLFSLIVFPLIIMKCIRFRELLISIFILIIFFVLVAFMTAKGLSENSSTGENIETFLSNLRGYLISPVVAMGQLFDTKLSFSLGSNTFRFFYAVASKMGFDINVPPLIRDSAYIPDETNVFTVFDPYFRDFSVFGILIFSLIILLIHFYLYIKMLRHGGPYIFLYSAILFALIMQFFQDMYFSLFSQWVQVFFWFWLLASKLKPRKLLFNSI